MVGEEDRKKAGEEKGRTSGKAGGREMDREKVGGEDVGGEEVCGEDVGGKEEEIQLLIIIINVYVKFKNMLL